MILLDLTSTRDGAPMIQKKICLLGAFAVGKTSLVAQYVHSMFSEKYQTTIGVKIDKKVIEIDGKEVNLVIWDLAGEDDFMEIRTSYLRGAAGYMMVIDGTRRSTLDVAVDIRARIERQFGALPFVAVVNKRDLASEWELDATDMAQLTDDGWELVLGSAKTGEGVEEVFEKLGRKMLAGG